MKYFSLFSGIGGFELGLEEGWQYLQKQRSGRSGSKRRLNKSNILNRKKRRNSEYPVCVGYSEIDKYAIQIYKTHFPKHKNYGDAKRIVWEEVPNFELLVAGFPCQSFSIAGKRGGFEDTRGTLFFEIARACRAKRPKLLLLENVKGLLSHDKGKTFGTILATLSDLGYVLEWQVLNSKDFGVPQNRERVFIVGYLRGECRPEVFPIEESNKEDIKLQRQQVMGAITARRGTAQSDGDYIVESKRTPQELKYVGAIMSKQNKKWLKNGKRLSRNFPQGQRVYSSKGIASSICGRAGGLGGKTGLYAVGGTKMDRISREQRSRIMARIRSRSSIEKLPERLKRLYLRSHPRGIFGNPDFGNKARRIAVFIDGCFWHKCPRHYRSPKTRKKYWIPKIEGNAQRDKEVSRRLRREGWIVIRIWEHELGD